MVAAVAVRLAYTAGSTVPSEPGFLVTFDPIYYHRQALAVADGHGFVAPYRGDGAPSADHPPLLVVVLASAARLGVRSFEAHRVITALIGAGVVPLLAVLARRLAGARAGVIAAVIAAVVPLLWVNDGQLMPEPLFAVTLAGALVLAHRLWDGVDRPLVEAAALGAVIALAALARGEGLMLLGFTVVPLAVWAPSLDGWRPRLATAAVATVACALVLTPWLAHNAARFEDRVLLSSSADSAFAGANCDLTYGGEGLGGWTTDCFAGHSNQELEESVFSRRIRADAVAHVRDNVGDLPRVVAARVGRLWGVYRTGDGVTLDELQNRPRPVSWAALGSLAVLVPLAVVGGLRLRRRARPVVLLAAMPAMATLVAALFYGNGRFRVPADVALVVLASVALAGLPPFRRTGDRPTGDRRTGDVEAVAAGVAGGRADRRSGRVDGAAGSEPDAASNTPPRESRRTCDQDPGRSAESPGKAAGDPSAATGDAGPNV